VIYLQEFYGRVTYHQELWIYPSVLLFHSDLSQHIITSRLRRQTAAKKNAANVGRHGLMFPFHSAATGYVDFYLCYLCQEGYVFAGFCLSVRLSVIKITQKVMDRSFRNFEDMSGVA